jgi:hypothetical protein
MIAAIPNSPHIAAESHARPLCRSRNGVLKSSLGEALTIDKVETGFVEHDTHGTPTQKNL